MVDSTESVYSQAVVDRAVPVGTSLADVLDPSKGFLPERREKLLGIIADHASRGIAIGGMVNIPEEKFARLVVNLHEEGYCEHSMWIWGECFSGRNCKRINMRLLTRNIKNVWMISATPPAFDDGDPAESVDFGITTQLLNFSSGYTSRPERIAIAVMFWRAVTAALPHCLDMSPPAFACYLRRMKGVYGMQVSCFHSEYPEAVPNDYTTDTVMRDFFGDVVPAPALENWFRGKEPTVGTVTMALDDLHRPLTLRECLKIANGARAGTVGDVEGRDGDSLMREILERLFSSLGQAVPAFDPEPFTESTFKGLRDLMWSEEEGNGEEEWIPLICLLHDEARAFDLSQDWSSGVILLRGVKPAISVDLVRSELQKAIEEVLYPDDGDDGSDGD
jgi:hypothetical protein